MCLYSTQRIIDQFKKNHKNDEYITCYKILKAYHSMEEEKECTNPLPRYKLTVSIRSPRQLDYEWKVGVNKAEYMLDGSFPFKETLKSDFQYIVFTYGIHVFLSERAAREHMNYVYGPDRGHLLVKVKCYMKNFVANGHDNLPGFLEPKQAVFSEVELTQEEWDLAMTNIYDINRK